MADFAERPDLVRKDVLETGATEKREQVRADVEIASHERWRRAEHGSARACCGTCRLERRGLVRRVFYLARQRLNRPFAADLPASPAQFRHYFGYEFLAQHLSILIALDVNEKITCT